MKNCRSGIIKFHFHVVIFVKFRDFSTYPYNFLEFAHITNGDLDSRSSMLKQMMRS